MDAPAVAVSADGKRVAVAWMDERAGKNQKDVWWRVAKEGRFTTPETALSDDARNIQAHPQLAIDDAGVVHAVWEDGRAGATKIYYASSAKPKNVPVSDEGRGGFPSLVITKSSIVVVYETGDEKVVARTFGR
jgi:hypothetical protein